MNLLHKNKQITISNLRNAPFDYVLIINIEVLCMNFNHKRYILIRRYGWVYLKIYTMYKLEK